MPTRLHRPLCALCTPLVLASSIACHPPSSKIPLDELPLDEQDQAQGEARDVVEPLAVERPADLLPAEVAVLAEAIQPAAVLDLLGPLDEYPEISQGRAELSGRLGGDIFDPTQWDTLGFDSHAPAGIGLLDVESEAFFVYLTLADDQRFEQTLYRFADLVGAREDLSSLEVGDARVYRLGHDASVVVREHIAMLIVVDNPEDAPRDYVVTAATIDPRESLGRSEPFTWAREQLAASDDGFVFVEPRGILEQVNKTRSDDYGIRYAEEELARARAAGESPQVIRDYEARVAEERRWQQEREARNEGGRALSQAVFGSVAAFVAAADLRNDGITAHGRALIPGAGLLQRLFLAPEHESPILTALGEPPVFVVDGRIDPHVGLELLDLLARAEGETLESIGREIEADSGVDLLGELVPALSGEGGFAVTQTRSPDPKHLGDASKTLGLAAYLGLRDAARLRKLLDGIARDKWMSGALVRAKRGDGWVLHVPEWRDVELTIVGERLIATTDSKFATRVRDAERGPVVESLTAAHPLQGPIQNPALRMYARWIGAVIVDAHDPWTQDADSMIYDYNSHPTLDPDEAAKVPRSREYKQKRAELDKAIAKLDAYNVRRNQAQFVRDLAYAEQLGDAGWQLEPLTDGIALTAQWRFAAGQTPLELLTKMFFGLSRGEDWTEYEQLNATVYTLVDELRMIRQADLDAAAAKRGR